MRVPTLAKTGLAVGATASVGAAATAPASRWYQELSKPRWQPPPSAFRPVWSTLYSLLALAGARALDRAAGEERSRFLRTYAASLALNAGWSMVFFRAKRPGAALGEILALDAANLALLRRAWRIDRAAGLAVVPYVAWTAFATALNASIARRNRATRIQHMDRPIE
jgi:tryptophan-rich sensory protein